MVNLFKLPDVVFLSAIVGRDHVDTHPLHYRAVTSKRVGGFCFEAATGNARSPSLRRCV